MIVPVKDGQFCISSHGCWRPGCYDTRRAAKYALRFIDEALLEMQEEANQAPEYKDRFITFERLQRYRREHKDSWNKYPSK